jgi:Mg-chelatase subunit ChlD
VPAPLVVADTVAGDGLGLDAIVAPTPGLAPAPPATPEKTTHESLTKVPSRPKVRAEFAPGSGGRPGALSGRLGEVIDRADLAQQSDDAWSDANKKVLNSFAATDDYSVMDSLKPGAGTQKGTLNLGFAVNGDRASPSRPSAVAATPALPAADGEAAGIAAKPTEAFQVADGAAAPNAHWYYDYDTPAKQDRSDRDVDKVARLGDVPALGRYFRSEGKATGGAGGAQTGQQQSPAKGIFGGAGSVTESGRQAGENKGIQLYADNAFRTQARFTEGDGRTKYGLSGGALRLKGEEKVKSVDLAGNEAGAFQTGISEGDAAGRQNRGDNIHSLNVVGYVNVPADAKTRGVSAGKPASSARSPIVLPASQPETRLALNDSSSLEQRLGQQQQKVREAQKKVNDLSAGLQITDGIAAGEEPSPLMTAETLRKLEDLRVESKAELVRQQTLRNRLQQQGNGQNSDRLLGLNSSVAALSNSLNNLEQEISKAATNDRQRANQTRPYFTAKRDLAELQRFRQISESEAAAQSDVAQRKPVAPAPVPQPEVQSSDNPFSTFSLNVSDVSYKLAGASLEKGVMPEPASIRSEEFLNAFNYRDPEALAGVPVAFAWERAQYPFAQNRDLLRFSIKTAALGRQPGRPLNLVLLLDNSGSMERADRVQIIREALRVLAGQLQPQDRFSVVTFSRTAHLWVDGVPGNKAGEVVDEISGLTPQGGTNLEEAMNLAYQTALRHYLANGVNRVVLLTDGAANLGNVEPEALKQKVEANRKQGIALDCFGIGWEGYNDDLLEVLSRNGDGRYGFVNTPEEAATEFAGQLAGALHVAASDVKVQVEFNPARVTAYRQIGYAKHQLKKEQFRDNTVDAAEIAAQEAGNALYVVEVNPAGNGPLATVRVRFKIPGTSDYREHEWAVPYTGNAAPLEQSSPAMRLAATAGAFAEWLVSSPYAAEVSPDRLLGYLRGVPEVYGADAQPKKLEWMIRQAKSIAGK